VENGKICSKELKKFLPFGLFIFKNFYCILIKGLGVFPNYQISTSIICRFFAGLFLIAALPD
jgi:hypothetical protein